MSLTRRRFILSASAAIGATAGARAGGRAEARIWRGSVMGGEASIRLIGEPDHVEAVLAEAAAEIRRLDRAFSLADPDSALSRLNRSGALDAPPLDLARAVSAASAWRARTGGAFDPRIQPLWRALAEGRDAEGALQALGRPYEETVRVDAAAITLAPGAALSLNGSAPGFVADRVCALLRRRGFASAAIDAGEMRVLGPHRRAVALPEIGVAAHVAEAAIAVSRPGALLLPNGAGHILALGGRRPDWAALAIVARDAETADALSTACAAASADEAASFLDGRDAALIGVSTGGRRRLLGRSSLLKEITT